MRRPTQPIPAKPNASEYDFDQSCPLADDESSDVSRIAPQSLSQLQRFGPVRATISQSSSSSRSSESSALAPSALRDIPGVVTASRLELPPVPMVSCGIAAVDTLTGGLPRGSLTEICGPASSGRTSLALAALGETTARGELCALVDTADSFDPHSAAAARIDLDRLLWIRCSAPAHHAASRSFHQSSGFSPDLAAALHAKQQTGAFMPPAKVWYGRPPARSERENATLATLDRNHKRESQHSTLEQKNGLTDPACALSLPIDANEKKHWAYRVEQALKASDLLLQGGGFGLIIVDLGDVPAAIARRIPLTSWFRFRRAVENTPAVLLTISQQSCARTCASLVLQLHAEHAISTTKEAATEVPSHTKLFNGFNVTVEVLRSRVDAPVQAKKPPRPARAAFDSRTQWAG
ncbi:MAG TPA: hypothetical protein VD837_14360 [Terriglobales bacterium]|nr:hypothetical protein [Terriglobales bacterium]